MESINLFIRIRKLLLISRGVQNNVVSASPVRLGTLSLISWHYFALPLYYVRTRCNVRRYQDPVPACCGQNTHSFYTTFLQHITKKKACRNQTPIRYFLHANKRASVCTRGVTAAIGHVVSDDAMDDITNCTAFSTWLTKIGDTKCALDLGLLFCVLPSDNKHSSKYSSRL